MIASEAFINLLNEQNVVFWAGNINETESFQGVICHFDNYLVF